MAAMKKALAGVSASAMLAAVGHALAPVLLVLAVAVVLLVIVVAGVVFAPSNKPVSRLCTLIKALRPPGPPTLPPSEDKDRQPTRRPGSARVRPARPKQPG